MLIFRELIFHDFLSDFPNTKMITHINDEFSMLFFNFVWEVFYYYSLLFWLRNWYREHVERVKWNGYFIANSALDSWLQLSIKQIYEKRFFSLLKSFPVLLAHNLVWSSIEVLILNIWLRAYIIQVFMKSLQQEWKHFLWVMLSETLELYCSSRNNIFNIPWCHIGRGTHIDFC